jgi:hypothetical protein
MKLRNIITVLLLIFVGVSIFVLAKDKTESSDQPVAAADNVETSGPDYEANAVQGKVVAYYFHYNRRCATCNKIEELAQKAISERFGDEISDGDLVFRSLNVEEKGNEHFETDYNMTSQSLILVDGREDRTGEWKSLDKIWELVWKEKEYVDYVDSEIRAFLEKS